jgi:hypothetical protein
MEHAARPDSKARAFRYVFLFGVTAALAFRSFVHEEAPMLAELRDSGVWAQAVIGDSRCQKSLHFDYSFVVSGSHYGGSGTAPGQCCVDVHRSVCEQFATGRSIRVVYSAEDPGANFHGDPGPAYEGLLIGSSICAAHVAGVVCIVLFTFARYNKSAAGRWARAIGL